MTTTRLSSKGQIIIPKSVRDARKWQTGQELVVVDTDEGILLTPQRAFSPTTLECVAACLHKHGVAKTEREIEAAMKKAARSAWRDRD
ncbi:MAG: AbrB/MazE/SpoVT family DNA-binding domain-containing protein [Pseudohongiella sp.]|nr:AbrB/MazE/SpoVT family DNA-binding domain-containing protein [Pseudohongiella sp.]